MTEVTCFRNEKIAVFGLGKAGKSAATALAIGGADVLAWDDNEKTRAALDGNVVEEAFLAESVTFQPPEEYDWKEIKALVLSPGIPLTHPKPHPIVLMAEEAGCPIICDIELLFKSYHAARYVGITGTNGKSTTTALIGHILKQAEFPCQIGGNIGVPALNLEALWQDGAYVLEMSSYQLDLLQDTKCDIAVLLNITPDHLDRHGGMEGYIASKKKIFDRQGANDTAIIGVDDPSTKELYETLKSEERIGKIIPISVQERVKGGISILDGVLYNDSDTEDMFGVKLGDIPCLPGEHNAQNIAAGYATAYCLNVDNDAIMDGIKSFAGLRHRLQLVGEVDHIKLVNDSKATNAEAASKALSSYEKNIYWIAGGLPKEGGIASLEPFFSRIRHAFLIGDAEENFSKTLEGKVSYSKCGELSSAFAEAATQALNAHEAAVILFSPACASFDQWKSFEVRGDAFCELAELLISQQSGEQRQEA